MAQSAAVRPEPSPQRKAAIAHGAALDHQGRVSVRPIPNFSLDHTIWIHRHNNLWRSVSAVLSH